jgi:hypothetical protein
MERVNTAVKGISAVLKTVMRLDMLVCAEAAGFAI